MVSSLNDDTDIITVELLKNP